MKNVIAVLVVFIVFSVESFSQKVLIKDSQGRVVLFNESNKSLVIDTVETSEAVQVACDSIVPCNAIIPCDAVYTSSVYKRGKIENSLSDYFKPEEILTV